MFFLISENTENLLGTILSRVQLTKTGRIDDHALEKMLVESYEMPPKTAHKITLMSEGSWAEARKLAGTDSYQTFYFNTFAEWARLCFKVDYSHDSSMGRSNGSPGKRKTKVLFHLFHDHYQRKFTSKLSC